MKRFLQNIRYDKKSDIDGPDLFKERLYVRGKDINDLIGNMTFTEAIFHILLNRRPTDVERIVFDAVLVSFHGGFGYSPPTVLLARLSATTGTSIPHALSAGYAGSGRYHVGAIENAMDFYESIHRAVHDGEDLKPCVRRRVAEIVKEKKTLYGFGHPLFKKDPRPERLREILRNAGYDTPYIRIYDELTELAFREKRLYPNIDGVNAAILLSLGFSREMGTGLFLLSRTAAMLAHVVEEQSKDPFYIEDVLYPLLRTVEKERSAVSGESGN